LQLGSKESAISREKRTPEEIIREHREAEVLLKKEMSMEEVMRQLGAHAATYYK